MSHYADQR